jgi:hypothetical protein
VSKSSIFVNLRQQGRVNKTLWSVLKSTYYWRDRDLNKGHSKYESEINSVSTPRISVELFIMTAVSGRCLLLICNFEKSSYDCTTELACKQTDRRTDMFM